MSAARRHVAVFFCIVLGPAFARCDAADCRALLAGSACWTWVEDGARKYGCRMCCFKHARVRGVGAA
jgi:hypothetical protein